MDKDASWFFRQHCTFLSGTVESAGFPDSDLPEIAFWGRSNVGKSSLINALLGRGNVARTSKTPGRTQQLNFFRLGTQLIIVDLPGYGYAQASKENIKRWENLIDEYLQIRPNLKRLYLLIDSRRGLMPIDLEVMTYLNRMGIAYQAVLTKTDKLSKTALLRVLEDTQNVLEQHPAALALVLSTSSEKGGNVEELRASIFDMIQM